MRRRSTTVGVLAASALVLAACDGLTFDPEPAQPGATVTVSNEGQAPCEPGDDVLIVLIEDLVDIMAVDEGDLGALPVISPEGLQADDDGRFSFEFAAPGLPGEYLVVGGCGPLDIEEGEIEAAQEEPADGYFDTFEVAQRPLTLTAAPDEVVVGGAVVATLSWCSNETDAGLLELADELGAPDEVMDEIDDLLADTPVIRVFVDGEQAAEVAADERFPTGTVDVTLELDEVGSHEITATCTHQSARWQVEFFDDGGFDGDDANAVAAGWASASGVRAAQAEYPTDLDGSPLVFDQADLAYPPATVLVVAPAPVDDVVETPPAQPPAPTPAAPVAQAQPAFVG